MPPQITIVREPRVYLVGRQVIDHEALSAFLTEEGVETWSSDTDVSSQKLVEIGSRLCYMSFAKPRPGGNSAHLEHILASAHGSVTEHAVFNLIITGVSRSFTHELIRHRAGFGFSQRSQRYVDETACSFVEPDMIADDPELHAVWLDAVETCQEAYQTLADALAKRFTHLDDKTLRRKRAREAARSILPNATETKIFVTANARAIRTMLEQRGSLHADAEIRKVAVMICRLMKTEAPNLFTDFEVKEEDGVEYLVNTYRKV